MLYSSFMSFISAVPGHLHPGPAHGPHPALAALSQEPPGVQILHHIPFTDHIPLPLAPCQQSDCNINLWLYFSRIIAYMISSGAHIILYWSFKNLKGFIYININLFQLHCTKITVFSKKSIHSRLDISPIYSLYIVKK